MIQNRVLIVESVMGRWFIQSACNALVAWSGSTWVRHSKGIGHMVQVSNFSSVEEARTEAQRIGFIVVGIEQEFV